MAVPCTLRDIPCACKRPHVILSRRVGEFPRSHGPFEYQPLRAGGYKKCQQYRGAKFGNLDVYPLVSGGVINSKLNNPPVSGGVIKASSA